MEFILLRVKRSAIRTDTNDTIVCLVIDTSVARCVAPAGCVQHRSPRSVGRSHVLLQAHCVTANSAIAEKVRTPQKHHTRLYSIFEKGVRRLDCLTKRVHNHGAQARSCLVIKIGNQSATNKNNNMKVTTTTTTNNNTVRAPTNLFLNDAGPLRCLGDNRQPGGKTVKTVAHPEGEIRPLML